MNMAAQNGRGFLVQMDISSTATTIGGSTSGSISINNEPIDITNKDDSGWRTLLADGKRSADVSFNGINLDDNTIGQVRTNHLAQTAEDFTVVIPGDAAGSAGSYTFSGVITSLEEAGEEGGALTYNVTVQSSGAVTFTDLV